VTDEIPRFLGEQPRAKAPPNIDKAIASEQSPTFIETPILLDAQYDATRAIGSGWNPSRSTTPREPRGSAAFATAGLAIILASWLLFSALASIIGFFNMSKILGSGSLALYLTGLAFVVYAGVREWRSLRDLHQVDALRAALGNATVAPEATRAFCRIWLKRISPRLPVAASIAATLEEVGDIEQLRALVRARLAAPLGAATHQIGISAATDAGALVMLSPHASWDGTIVAIRGLRVIHQVALLYGVRPGMLVTLALFGRVARAVVQTAATDLVSQSVIDHLVGRFPITKHLAAFSGASVAGVRLYRLAKVAARACDPMSS
jgi:putative membrane protein